MYIPTNVVNRASKVNKVCGSAKILDGGILSMNDVCYKILSVGINGVVVLGESEDFTEIDNLITWDKIQ
jgi:hypothetical protein